MSRRLPNAKAQPPAGCAAVGRSAGAPCWTKAWKKGAAHLFNQKALAKVFRAKMLATIEQAGLILPRHYPEHWVAHVKAVGQGSKALV